MLWGLAFMPIILNWSQMAPIFKALIKEPEKEFDPDRPISYRLTWLLTIGSFIAWYLVGIMLLQIIAADLLIWMIMLAISYIGVGRLLQECGGWIGCYTQLPYASFSYWNAMTGATVVHYVVPLGADVSSYSTGYMFGIRGDTYHFGERGPFFALTSFRMGDTSKTRSRNILIVLIVGLIVGTVACAYIFFFDRLWAITVMGPATGQYARVAVPYAKLGNMWVGEAPIASGQVPPQVFVQIVIGFAIIAALSFLGPRVSILKGLSTAGLTWGASGLYIFWVSWAVGFIVKYLVLRTGGTKMYESTLKPLALGLLAGAFLTLSVTSLGNWLVFITLRI
jgi:hypothetical protein